ncbi:MAG TPA: hypothetical protein VIJ88_02140 [Candidatus Paceibacterota bacterium]
MITPTFQKVQKTIDVSDFRAAMASHLAKAKHKPLVVSARRGGESFVVLSVDAYNKLVETWEDEMDAKELDRLVRLNKGKKLVEWKRIKARYV